jgi:hypothetical protein
MMGQKPYVSIACVDTEIAITTVFSRAKSTLIGAGGDLPLPTGMRFNIA